ncbi:MAG TPA: NAD-dependent epimerase/dehydratase family protein [Gaiellaceae bacterium]|jgi:UDP-glucose 4-epimerase|nr:NAD-dependent epimerase/dehydratase family protein [Gaiellaceae bacterium]
MSRRTLVTGGAGFIGSRLCERLVERGDAVISVDNYFAGSREIRHRGVDYREGHTRDVEKLVRETVDLVYHLGEYSRVERSVTEPQVVFDLNTIGTFSVLEFCRQSNPKLVYAGSSTKFADGGLGRDQSPYAFTKATNSELVRNYGEWYGIDYAITYFYNVYGPGERAGTYGTVIEIFRERRLRGEPLPVTSPGTQRRNFTHVDDIVDGLLLIGDKGKGDEFGLGASESFSILEIAALFGGSVELRPEVPGNRMTAKLDVTKSHALGWEAKQSVRAYIAEAVAAAQSGHEQNGRVQVSVEAAEGSARV